MMIQNTHRNTPYPPPPKVERRRGGCSFGHLALLYYPNHAYRSAVRLFRQEIHLTRGLWQALERVGYNDKLRKLTARQILVIEKFLGEP